MKKMMWIGLVMALALGLSMPDLYAQQPSAASQQPGWYCPGGMGRGAMMGGGRGRGCGMGQGRMMNNRQDQPLTQDQAKQLLEGYLTNSGSADLKLGEITDQGNVFEATILKKDGSVDKKIQVDKNTGWFRNVS